MKHQCNQTICRYCYDTYVRMSVPMMWVNLCTYAAASQYTHNTKYSNNKWFQYFTSFGLASFESIVFLWEIYFRLSKYGSAFFSSKVTETFPIPKKNKVRHRSTININPGILYSSRAKCKAIRKIIKHRLPRPQWLRRMDRIIIGPPRESAHIVSDR